MAPVKQYPASSIIDAARAARSLTDRTGLIATAVCDHPQIIEILEGLAELGYHIALSSIKIDAIEERIDLARDQRALAVRVQAQPVRAAASRKVDARRDGRRDRVDGHQLIGRHRVYHSHPETTPAGIVDDVPRLRSDRHLRPHPTAGVGDERDGAIALIGHPDYLIDRVPSHAIGRVARGDARNLRQRRAVYDHQLIRRAGDENSSERIRDCNATGGGDARKDFDE